MDDQRDDYEDHDAPSAPVPARLAVAAAALAAPAPRAGKHDALIERWFAHSFHGHPAMNVTDAFNHVRNSVDELKRLLAAEEN